MNPAMAGSVRARAGEVMILRGSGDDSVEQRRTIEDSPQY